MAEGVGFEPTDTCGVSGFQDRCNKPLYHPSKRLHILPIYGRT